MLDAVVRGLRGLPDIHIERPPRMADFAEWAEACGPGFGWEKGDFLDAYGDNQREVVETAAEASPLVPVLETLLVFGGYGPEGFDGTAHQLLVKLRGQCSDSTQRSPWFPKTDAQMGTRIRRIVKLLNARGIDIAHYKFGRQKKRMLTMRCRSEKVFSELAGRLRGERGDAGPPPMENNC